MHRLAECSNLMELRRAGIPVRTAGGLLPAATLPAAQVSPRSTPAVRTGHVLIGPASVHDAPDRARHHQELFTRRDMQDLVVIGGRPRNRGAAGISELNTSATRSASPPPADYSNVFYLSTNAKGSNVGRPGEHTGILRATAAADSPDLHSGHAGEHQSS